PGEPGEIVDVRTDGTDPRDLSNRHGELEDGPAYSPDGRRIAYTEYLGEGSVVGARIVVAAADGTDPQPLPGLIRLPGQRDVDPAWSPDGTRIAFARMGPGDTSQILVADAVTGVVVATIPPPPTDEGTAASFDREPTWSPDGTTLAFARAVRYLFDPAVARPGIVIQPVLHGDDTDIWTAQAADGGGQRNLTEGADPACIGLPCSPGRDRGPAWSPDGTTIAFARNGNLRLMNPDGSNDRALAVPFGPFSPVQFSSRDPAWSPDGTEIAFSARAASAQRLDILVAKADGSAVRALTTDLDTDDTQPTWQPTADLAVTMTADPADIPFDGTATLTLTVTNLGPVATDDVRATVTLPPGLPARSISPEQGSCVPLTLSCDLGVLAAGVSTRVRVEVHGTEPGTHTATASAAGAVIDPELANNQAQAQVTVGEGPKDLSVVITVAPTPGYVGGHDLVATYTVRNAGRWPADDVRLTTQLPADLPVRDVTPQSGCTSSGSSCDLGTLGPGAATSVRITLSPVKALSAVASGTVTTSSRDPDPANNTATAPVRVVQPRFVLNPPIGPPGFVTLAVGSDFPPGAAVSLTWAPGITAEPDAVTVARDGTFNVQVLVLRRDVLGPRDLTATGAGFGEVSQTFLVVPRSVPPPRFLGRG
ncbi:MAG TPA: hypothetical protein VGR21_06345, partial [Cryptosporangiaceae bacterium]|nr:hypothetical protein [Cryptosporangiaceae bacterium]